MLERLDPDKFSIVLAKYKSALERLEEWGVRIHRNSRLRRYEDDLRFLSGSGVPSSPQALCDLAFSLIEADEIIEIATIDSSQPSNAVYERLRQISKDPYIRTNSTESPGRNLQFELYVRALLIHGGLECSMGTPDITAIVQGQTLDIEAKRPMSENGVDRCVRKALDVLSRKSPGIILMSLDHVLLGDNNVITLEEGDVENDGLKLLETETTRWLSVNKPILLQRLLKKRSACAMLFLVKVPMFAGTLHQMYILRHLRLVKILNLSDSAQLELVDEMDQAISSIWFSDTYLY